MLITRLVFHKLILLTESLMNEHFVLFVKQKQTIKITDCQVGMTESHCDPLANVQFMSCDLYDSCSHRQLLNGRVGGVKYVS